MVGKLVPGLRTALQGGNKISTKVFFKNTKIYPLGGLTKVLFSATMLTKVLFSGIRNMDDSVICCAAGGSRYVDSNYGGVGV